MRVVPSAEHKIRGEALTVVHAGQVSNRGGFMAVGGINICVSNAGIASTAPIEDTSLALWRRNIDILAAGYFLISRIRLLKSQGLGGSIMFIGSKNALAASQGASAYCTAKAAELHLARCLPWKRRPPAFL